MSFFLLNQNRAIVVIFLHRDSWNPGNPSNFKFFHGLSRGGKLVNVINMKVSMFVAQTRLNDLTDWMDDGWNLEDKYTFYPGKGMGWALKYIIFFVLLILIHFPLSPPHRAAGGALQQPPQVRLRWDVRPRGRWLGRGRAGRVPKVWRSAVAARWSCAGDIAVPLARRATNATGIKLAN